VVNVVVDLPIDDAQGVAKLEWSWWPISGQQGAEQPVVELGVEDRHLDALGGEHVAIGPLDAADQALEPQPAKVVVIWALL
jgi:hypothetical protein